MPLKILLLADTHLGFDLPQRPRIQRRRRGHDFQANFEEALRRAEGGGIDAVVHGGDLFHRPRPSSAVTREAMGPLLEVARAGIPVLLVPGNHERSRVPRAFLQAHPNLYVFLRPGTVVVRLRGRRVAFAGFPYHRRGVREAFPGILETTGWRKPEAEIRILCMHHCVEGARVGPSDFTFRGAPDVIRCRDLPSGFAAVVSGHIHRHQVLRRDLEGRSLPTPVFYPGSVERTAFAEAGERKGFVVLTLPEGPRECLEPRGEFVPLSARPMVARDLRPPGGGGEDWEVELLTEAIRTAVARVPRDAVLRLRVQGSVPPDARVALSAPRLRTLAPETMNVEALILEDRRRRWGRPNRWERRAEGRGARSGNGAGPPGRDARPQLQLPLELD